MAESRSGRDTKKMRPHFEEIQAHYDLSDDFFGTFQDPSRTYSCAFFERDDMSLEEAQMAKIDLALEQAGFAARHDAARRRLRLGLGDEARSGKTRRQRVGLTLSKNQSVYCQQLLEELDTDRSRQVFLRGWEEFDEPVDRIISIEAFEAFPKDRYAAFFETCYRILPTRWPDGAADDHGPSPQALARDGHPDHHDRPEVHAIHRQGDLPWRRNPLRRGHRRILRRLQGFRWNRRST